MKIRFLLLLLLGTLVVSSCRRELEKPSWEIGMVGPVLHSSLGLEDLIADSLLQVNPDSSVTLVYEGTVYELILDSLLQLPDTTLADTFKLPSAVPSINVNPGQQIFSTTEEQSFSAQGVQLTMIDLLQGKVDVRISSTINQPVDFNYQILSASKLSQVFSVTIPVPAGSIANPAIVDTSFDLSSYHMDLISASGTEFNTYSTKAVIKMAAGASTTTLTNADKVIIRSTFGDLKPSYAQGYFGNRIESISGEPAYFDLFEKIISGTLDIDQIDVQLIVRNYIGADARVTFNAIEAARGTTTQALSHSIIGSTVNINRATDPGGYSSPSLYSVALNNGNSNIDQIIEMLPTSFVADMEMEINPLGNVSAHHDFLYHPKTIEADLNFTMPLSVIANELTLADTIDLTLTKGENGYVTSGNFDLEINNGFPLEGAIQLYFLDGNGMISDSIVSPSTFLPAYTNTQHVVTAKRSSQISLHLNESQMNRLYNGERLLLKVVFSTSSLSQHVTIYDHYRIDIDLRGDFNYRIEFAE